MSEYFYRTPDRVIGPLSWQNIETLCERGLIGPATELRKNDGFWTKAGNIDELSCYFEIIGDRAPRPKRTKAKSSSSDAALNPPKAATTFDDIFGPKKAEELNMAQLYSQSQSTPLKSNSKRHQDEEGSSYFSIGIVIIIGLAAHGAIAWNYGSIMIFFRDLFGMK